jgi:hypothetical protein
MHIEKSRANKIRAMLKERGIKQKDIAPLVKPHGVKDITVRVVIGGFGHSRPVKEAIAEALNISYEKLWGKAA